MLASLRLVFRVVAEMNQGVMPLRRFHDDVAATTAIATRGATPGYKLLPAESHTTIPAVPGLDPYFSFINEHK